MCGILQVYHIGSLDTQVPQQARNVSQHQRFLCITVTAKFRRLSAWISAPVKSPTPHT